MSIRGEKRMDKKMQEKLEYCLGCKAKPCKSGCPLENDITQWIQMTKAQEYEKAYEILCNTTVLPAICGRICPHGNQCEGSCIRGKKQEPVSIGEIEAYLGDIAIERGYEIPKFTNIKQDKKVAIVGGGPAGLSAAAYLARSGYRVTIFEKHNELGGILSHGIPEFRLEKEVVEKTIQNIVNLGVEVQYGKKLGQDITLLELQNNYQAVFLALGANIGSKLEIPGEELPEVLGANELLEYQTHPDYTGKKVAIVGGGNVAMDAARTIQALGAKKVMILYRRSEKEMPAEKKEIQAAREEGIEFLFQICPVQIIGKGKVEKIECIHTELVKKEGETRAVPVEIPNSNFELEVDYVIKAVGSIPEQEIVKTLGVQTTKNGKVRVNEKYETSQKGIFAGGDLSGTKATVAWASRSGREAAKAMIEYLENRN